jgi:6,7-dimethyl-8-ribityllumazine synthase
MLLDIDDAIDAIICLGCVIQGETRHFEFISQAVADGIMRVSLDYACPVVFGVLTCDTMEQAQDRAGGKHGNKGAEAAYTALKMIELEQKLL